jgi:hypothetical protein
MDNPVAESALAGSSVLRFRVKPGNDSAAESPPPPPPSDVERVIYRVRTMLLADATTASVDTAIAAVLRDTQFAAAWNNANALILAKTPRDELLCPVVPECFRSVVGAYRDEIQAVASAWGEVVRGVFRSGPRPEILEIAPGRLLLPAYLDDESLPIEVWEALRSRDAAAVCYIALIEGSEGGSPIALLAEYAERHCFHQRRWLDLLSWMFGLPCPSIVPASSRQDWSHIFAETRSAQRGVDMLFEHASMHPNGFSVGDLSTTRE